MTILGAITIGMFCGLALAMCAGWALGRIIIVVQSGE